MGTFERYLVIFGGCGPYQHKLKKRNCFQDVIVYDTQTGCYVKFDGGPASLAAEIDPLNKTKSNFDSQEPDVMKQRISQIATAENAPQIEQEVRNEFRTRSVVEAASARSYHVGAVIGPGLLIHGGQGMENQETLGDWNLFDFGLSIWVKVSCYENLAEAAAGPFELRRKMHSLSSMLEPNIHGGKELTRKMWCSQLKDLCTPGKQTVIDQGMYMFGGLDEKGKPTSDLFWINFDVNYNLKTLSPITGEFKSSTVPDVRLAATRIVAKGRGPVARSQHAATVFKNKLVISGGRSDLVYSFLRNVALNDLHIYDIKTNSWSAIALYGDIPKSRWGHKLCANANSIMLFGGMNLSSYNDSEIFEIHVDENKVIEFLSQPIVLKPDQKFKEKALIQSSKRSSVAQDITEDTLQEPMIEAAEATLGLESTVMPMPPTLPHLPPSLPHLPPPGDGVKRNNLDIQFLNAIDTDEELNKTLSLSYQITRKNSNDILK